MPDANPMTHHPHPPEGMPERWQLVPVEPTEEMQSAIDMAHSCDPADQWRAALAAAPKAPPMPDEVASGMKQLEAAAKYPRRKDEGPPLRALLAWLSAQGITAKE